MRIIFTVAALLVAGVAAADSDGMYFEQSATSSGVTVTRMRDTHEGVICYVAHGGVQGNGYVRISGEIPSISCLREERK